MDRPSMLNKMKLNFANSFAGIHLDDMVFESVVVVAPVGECWVIIPIEGIAARLMIDTRIYVGESFLLQNRLSTASHPGGTLFINSPTSIWVVRIPHSFLVGPNSPDATAINPTADRESKSKRGPSGLWSRHD